MNAGPGVIVILNLPSVPVAAKQTGITIPNLIGLELIGKDDIHEIHLPNLCISFQRMLFQLFIQ